MCEAHNTCVIPVTHVIPTTHRPGVEIRIYGPEANSQNDPQNIAVDKRIKFVPHSNLWTKLKTIQKLHAKLSKGARNLWKRCLKRPTRSSLLISIPVWIQHTCVKPTTHICEPYNTWWSFADCSKRGNVDNNEHKVKNVPFHFLCFDLGFYLLTTTC